MDQGTSLDIQHILITDDESPIDVTTQLQLDRRLPEGRKTCEELLKSPALQTATEDQIRQFVFHGQCLVLGDSGVGKTSLVKSLTGGSFDPRQVKTQGIDQSLVDGKWKTLDTTKDLTFGSSIQFLEEVVFQLTFVEKAGNITVQESIKLKVSGLVMLSMFGLGWLTNDCLTSVITAICFTVPFYAAEKIVTSCVQHFNFSHLLRSAFVLTVLTVIRKVRVLTIGAFLSVMTISYFRGTVSIIPGLWTCDSIYVCFAMASVVVLSFVLSVLSILGIKTEHC